MLSIIRRYRRWVYGLLISLVGIIALSSWGVYYWLLIDLPDPGQLYQHTTAPSTQIYDRHGVLLYELNDPHQGAHTPLTLNDIPLTCRQATIATEDATFYQNPGVDIWAIVRALYINFQGGEVLSGGSTITQQLARNLLLSPQERQEVTLTRKLREAILAWRMARQYSKDEILILYLNEVYYGNLAYGLEAASRIYFGKQAAELDLAECALLAGLPQNPANYNPLENLEVARTRQQTVLDLMLKQNFISVVEADYAQQEQLHFAAIPFPIKAPHFVMHILGQLENTYGLEAIYQQGLQVETTLDLSVQETALHFIHNQLSDLAEPRSGQPPHQVHNAAVVVFDVASGDLLAMVGSPDYFDPTIDGAVNGAVALRQPGSSIKPITYAAALDPQIAARVGYAPLTAASMILDVRTAFITREGDPYAPENYDRTWHGPVLLRPALANSYNLPAVKVLDYVGLETMIDLAQQMGVSTLDARRLGLATTLGGGEVQLLALTRAFGVLANEGRSFEAHTIRRIKTYDGQVLYEANLEKTTPTQLIDLRTAYLIADILSDNETRRAAFGPNSPLHLSRPAAVKTGTSQDWRDNWTIGYTPDLVAGVWVGNADNHPMTNVSGVTGAAPIWHHLMETLHKGRPARWFTPPEGIVERTVCSLNGLLPFEGVEDSGIEDVGQGEGDENTLNLGQQLKCPHTITELFITGTEPTEVDDWHQLLPVDKRNGLLARSTCPPEFVKWQSFIRYPAEVQLWATSRDIADIPAFASPLCDEVETEPALVTETVNSEAFSLVFISPDPGSVFRLAPDIPINQQKIVVQVRPVDGVNLQQVTLLVNGEPFAIGTQSLWQMAPGHYIFEAEGVDIGGRPLKSAPLSIEIR